MLENYSNLVSVGITVSKPELINSLEQSKDPWDVNTGEIEDKDQGNIDIRRHGHRHLSGGMGMPGFCTEILYKDIMLEACRNLVSGGLTVSKPELINSLEQSKEPLNRRNRS
ncbi:zinc finger protein 300 [Mesocricetus auratus]|uniref:Zinc finger protein 300 n=1 Tax=Mesocricetus auratus TaxID=10036 RepID=A0A3Q0D8U5_MESAU|nr:zinc finger protein 300 [Mesocricetus auratus]